MNAAKPPVLILVNEGEGADAQRALEQAGYEVQVVDQLPEKPILRVLPLPTEPRHRPRRSARLVPRGSSRWLLMPSSRAARLLRASSYALNRWQDAGWLRRFPKSPPGRRLVDLREAVLVAWLHHGPACVSDELARLVRKPVQPLPGDDPCLAKLDAWRRTLGRAACDDLETAVREAHDHGYTCREVQASIARLTPRSA